MALHLNNIGVHTVDDFIILRLAFVSLFVFHGFSFGKEKDTRSCGSGFRILIASHMPRVFPSSSLQVKSRSRFKHDRQTGDDIDPKSFVEKRPRCRDFLLKQRISTQQLVGTDRFRHLKPKCPWTDVGRVCCDFLRLGGE